MRGESGTWGQKDPGVMDSRAPPQAELVFLHHRAGRSVSLPEKVSPGSATTSVLVQKFFL